jgi:hypothetical protein
MASKVAIKNSYPLLQDFFRLKLGIPNAPSEILFEELTLLANEWKSRTIPEDIQNRVTSMLVDLSDAVSEPLTDHTTQALRSLGGLPIFPVRCPKLGLRLCTVNDFYVPDKNGQYAKLLHGQVALLAIPSAIILRLQPVLDTIIFKSRIRYLETSISRRLVAQGQRVLDTAATANFAIKVEYIKRYNSIFS